MKNSTFYDVLKNEVRKDLRQELEAEIRQSSPGYLDPHLKQAHSRHEILTTWLATHLDQVQTRLAQPKKCPYKAPPRVAQASPRLEAQAERRELTGQALTPEQICALAFLNTNGASLNGSFSESELKSAWRGAALRTHPDCHAQKDLETIKRMNSTFQSIADAYEILKKTLKV